MEVKPSAPGTQGGVVKMTGAIKDSCGTKLGLARRAGCSNAAVHKLLSGEMKTCSPALAVAVTVALKLELWDVFVPKSSINSGQKTAGRAA